MSEVMLGRDELVGFLRRWAGYCLTGDVEEQCWVLATGGGSNGKGTLAETLLAVLGEDVATTAAPNLLIATRFGDDRHPAELAALEGKRVIFASEVPEGSVFHEKRLKELSGGDTIRARGMHQEWRSIPPTGKLWLYMNTLPAVRDQSHGFWRRVRVVPFDAKFLLDKGLRKALWAEREGILAWAVRGCLEWQANGLAAPAEVLAATANYEAEQDVFARFLEDLAEIDKTPEGKAPKELFALYVLWCEGNKVPVLPQNGFARQMTRLGWMSAKVGNKRFWTATGKNP